MPVCIRDKTRGNGLGCQINLVSARNLIDNHQVGIAESPLRNHNREARRHIGLQLARVQNGEIH